MRSLFLCLCCVFAISAIISHPKEDSSKNKALIPISAEEGVRHIPPGANEEGIVVRSKRYYGCGCCGGCCGCDCNCGTMAPMASMAPCGCYGCCG